MPEIPNPYGARSNSNDPYGLRDPLAEASRRQEARERAKPAPIPMFPQEFGPTAAEGYGDYQPDGHLDDERTRKAFAMFPGDDPTADEFLADDGREFPPLAWSSLPPERRRRLVGNVLRLVVLPAGLIAVQVATACRRPELRSYLLYAAASNLAGNALILWELRRAAQEQREASRG